MIQFFTPGGYWVSRSKFAKRSRVISCMSVNPRRRRIELREWHADVERLAPRLLRAGVEKLTRQDLGLVFGARRFQRVARRAGRGAIAVAAVAAASLWAEER